MLPSLPYLILPLLLHRTLPYRGTLRRQVNSDAVFALCAVRGKKLVVFTGGVGGHVCVSHVTVFRNSLFCEMPTDCSRRLGHKRTRRCVKRIRNTPARIRKGIATRACACDASFERMMYRN